MSDAVINFFFEPLGIHIAFFVLTIYPIWHCFRRVGLPGYWALLLAIPLVGFTATLLALVAQRWPNAPARKAGAGGKAARRAG